MAGNRERPGFLFSVGIGDCRVDTFAVGGNGGSGKDTSNTGVRVTHPPSGAVGRATESRRQLENKRAAFRRMTETAEFRAWHRREVARRIGSRATAEEVVDAWTGPGTLKVEVRGADGRWRPETAEERAAHEAAQGGRGER